MVLGFPSQIDSKATVSKPTGIPCRAFFRNSQLEGAE
jgi:hypothetical protein